MSEVSLSLFRRCPERSTRLRRIAAAASGRLLVFRVFLDNSVLEVGKRMSDESGGRLFGLFSRFV